MIFNALLVCLFVCLFICITSTFNNNLKEHHTEVKWYRIAKEEKMYPSRSELHGNPIVIQHVHKMHNTQNNILTRAPAVLSPRVSCGPSPRRTPWRPCSRVAKQTPRCPAGLCEPLPLDRRPQSSSLPGAGSTLACQPVALHSHPGFSLTAARGRGGKKRVRRREK